MKRINHRRIVPLILLVILGSCGGSREKGEGHHDESEISYKEGEGLRIPSETLTAIGFEEAEYARIVEAPTHPILLKLSRTDRGNWIARGSFHDDGHGHPQPGILVPLFTEGGEELGSAELTRMENDGLLPDDRVLEFRLLSPPASGAGEGDLVRGEFKGGSGPVAAWVVPRTAILRTWEGSFVYVKNQARWLRTAVRTGETFDAGVEIKEGLYEGDTVAKTPVTWIHLIELRQTKGGGHSH